MISFKFSDTPLEQDDNTGSIQEFMPYFYHDNLDSNDGTTNDTSRSFSKFLYNHFNHLIAKGPDGESTSKSAPTVRIVFDFRQVIKHGDEDPVVHLLVRELGRLVVVGHDVPPLDLGDPVEVLAHFHVHAAPVGPALPGTPGHDPDQLVPARLGVPVGGGVGAGVVLDDFIKC